MKKIEIDKSVKNNIITLSVSGAIIAVLILILINLPNIFAHIGNFLGVVSPFLWGILFAYLGKGLALKVETILPKSWSLSIRRVIGSIVTILFIILCFIVIIIIIVPQLISSISSIIISIQNFVSNPEVLSNIVKSLHLENTNIITIVKENFNGLKDILGTFIKGGNSLFNSTKDFIGNLANFGLGFVIALFFLIERGKIKDGLTFLGHRFLKTKTYNNFKDLYNLTVSRFYNYFRGSIIDCVLVGLECFVFMIIFKLEYASLISVIVGITNIIPFFGPFIGGIPSFLILLIVSPTQAFIFLGIVILVQQIDGNFIAPKIIGDSVGVPRLWVMFVIIVAGAYFGFFGMIFGVPLFSVIYTYISMYLNKNKDTSK